MHKNYSLIFLCFSIPLFIGTKAFAAGISNCNFSNLSKESTTEAFNISEEYYIDVDIADKDFLRQCLKGKSSTTSISMVTTSPKVKKEKLLSLI